LIGEKEWEISELRKRLNDDRRKLELEIREKNTMIESLNETVENL
jgi:hypothetical protein